MGNCVGMKNNKKLSQKCTIHKKNSLNNTAKENSNDALPTIKDIKIDNQPSINQRIKVNGSTNKFIL